jgi:hypothetical protein
MNTTPRLEIDDLRNGHVTIDSRAGVHALGRPV